MQSLSRSFDLKAIRGILKAMVASIAMILFLPGFALAQQTPAASAQNSPKEWVTFSAERVAKDCPRPCNRHAVIFVHGIFGARETWLNTDTSEYFPAILANDASMKDVDIYRADYENYMLLPGPSMKDVLESFARGMIRIHQREYKTTQFVAHSLGGVIVRRYLLHVKSRYGHKVLSLYRQAILLGTPVDGSYFASIAQIASSNQLFRVIEPINQNDFLQMLNSSIDELSKKHHQTFCPSLSFYVGYEEKATFLDKIVSPESAARSIECSVDLTRKRNCIQGFDKTHSGLSKPDSSSDKVYLWVQSLIRDCADGLSCARKTILPGCGTMESFTKGSASAW